MAEGRGQFRQAVFGIRGRVVIWFLGVFVLVLAIGLLSVRQVLLVRLADDVEAALAQETEELRLLASGVDPETGESFGADVEGLLRVFVERNIPTDGEVVIGLVDGRLAVADPPSLADALVDGTRLAEWSAVDIPTWGESPSAIGTVRWLAVPIVVEGGPEATFVVSNLIGADRESITQDTQVLAGVMLVMVLLASGLGWLAAGRALAPIRSVTRAARAISDEDLSARIPVERDDEVGELTRTFNDMLERLDVAFADHRTFLNDLGHELRTPITIVRGHLELLPDDPAERAEAVAVCTDELDRMARFVSDLVLLAKAQRPDFLVLRPVEVPELVDGLEARATALEPQRRWRIASVAPVTLVADPDRLTQAMVNLLANAAQHTEVGGEIRFGADVVGDEVRLFVSDDGPGVGEAEQEVIFQRFGRGVDTVARRRDGSGLGLAIVAAVAEAHGGRVGLDSAPGAGATFSIFLPAPAPGWAPPPPPPDDAVLTPDDPSDSTLRTDRIESIESTDGTDAADRTQEVRLP